MAIRAIVERYGIGVRGGVITPQVEDEDYFRQLIGAPAASALVKEAWTKEKVRRPVTLGESILADKPAATEGEKPHGEAPATPTPEPEDDPAEGNKGGGYGASSASAAGSVLAPPPQ